MKYFSFFLVSLFLCACTNDRQRAILLFAESRMEEQPDSVLQVLGKMELPSGIFCRGDQAHYALLWVEALNKSGREIPNDSLLNIALNYYSERGSSLELAKAYYYQGCYFVTVGMERNSIEAFSEAGNVAQEFTDYNLLGLIYNRLGDSYANQFYSDTAMIVYEKSIDYYRKAGNLKNERIALTDKGLTFLYNAQYDSSLYYLNLAQNINSVQKDTSCISLILNLKGFAYYCLDDIPCAKQLVLESIKLMGDSVPINYYVTLSDIYAAENKMDSARYLIHKILQKSHEAGLYNRLTAIEEKKKNYELALIYSKQTFELADSLYRVFRKNSVIEIQQRYNYMRERAEKDRLKIRMNNLLLLGSGLLMSFSVVIVIYQIINSRKKKTLLENRLLIEQLKRSELQLKKMMDCRLEEKDDKLKFFFQKRVDVLKKCVELSYKYGGDEEKFREHFNRMISASAFQTEDWELLREGVNVLTGGLADILKKDYPVLTDEDLKYCCLVCSGFQTQEIVILLGISDDAVYKKRTRIRKRLNLKERQNLETFLESLCKK